MIRVFQDGIDNVVIQNAESGLSDVGTRAERKALLASYDCGRGRCHEIRVVVRRSLERDAAISA